MFISKFGGVYFLLVYHVTPHMLQMTTLRMKFYGAFLDNDNFSGYVKIWQGSECGKYSITDLKLK